MRLKSVFRLFGGVALVAGLVVFGQQCSRVGLERWEELSFLSLGENPLRLDPPVDYPEVRRFVFLVDMSHSMVSGPCIQDVDAGIGFSTSPAHAPYDPNKGTGNPNDHRASGIDCKTDPSLPIARSSIVNVQPNLNSNPRVYFKTHLGNDHEKNRLQMVKNWIEFAIRDNPPLLTQRTKVMLIPFSGGNSQIYMEKKMKQITGSATLAQFFDLTDPKLMSAIQWMKEEHDFNLENDKSLEIYTYGERTMGTSTPGSLLPAIYDAVQKDMRALNTSGLLSYTDYQIIPISDGLVSPVQKNIEDTLKLMPNCSTCAADPENCKNTCGTLVQKMYDAWGRPEDNSVEKMDFYYGLMQSLPFYYGAGFTRVDFVSLQRERVRAAYPNEKTIFEQLEPFFNIRKVRLAIWPSNDDKPAFRLIGDSSTSTSYKVTNLFVLNENVRVNGQGALSVDSDGDGLTDAEEAIVGTNPLIQRSNGYCLDSFMAQSAFATRCTAMAKARSCDPTLDSDGDSLNECEESLLGTNPFDFDTDSDGIPDSLEWVYGYNPLHSEEGMDGNGDGYLNMINFASNLPPQANLKELPSNYLSQYAINYQGKEKITHPALGEVLLELYEVIVKNLPIAAGLSVSADAQTKLYVSRVGTDPVSMANNEIPYRHQLLSVIPSQDRNTVTAIARMIEVSEPKRAYWRVFKTDVPLTSAYKQPRLDLSQFKMIRARDRNDE